MDYVLSCLWLWGGPGLSHLDKLTTYVSFLEQKNVTTKG
jgi:hypothetical protein